MKKRTSSTNVVYTTPDWNAKLQVGNKMTKKPN